MPPVTIVTLVILPEASVEEAAAESPAEPLEPEPEQPATRTEEPARAPIASAPLRKFLRDMDLLSAILTNLSCASGT